MAILATDTSHEDFETFARACGMLDRSERGKLALSGPEAIEFLNGQVSNELAELKIGEGRYAAHLTHKGKMLGDLRILAVASPQDGTLELLLDTERVALQELFDMIRRSRIGYRVELHKRTLERGLVSLIGPRAGATAGVEQLSEQEHSSTPVEIAGIAAMAIRTDVGVDILCDSGDAQAVSQLLEDRGARPVAEQSAECLRIEHGRPRYGIDLDDSVIPQEAALNERAVSFTKGCYVGQETVARLFYRGKPNRHLRGLLLSAPGAPGEQLMLGDRSVGQLASTAVSPRLGPIALALVRREAEPGATLEVPGRDLTAKVVELPFVLPT